MSGSWTTRTPSAHRSFAAPTQAPQPAAKKRPGDDGHRYFSPEIARVLKRTPDEKWSAFGVLLDAADGTATLMVRGELAAWLDANDLRTLAREALSRRVERGAILVLVLRENEAPVFRVLFRPRGSVASGQRPGVPRGRTAP